LETSKEDKPKWVITVPKNIHEILALDRTLTEESLTKIAEDIDEFGHPFQILSESIGLIKKAGIARKHTTDEELIVKGITVRIYHDISSALTLMLSGRYQVSLMAKRDLLECSLLLQKFALDSGSILRWKQDSESNEFRAGNIRKYIEKYGKEFHKEYIEGMWLLYAYFSTGGTHPNYRGIALMLTKENDPAHKLQPWPFFDLQKMKTFIPGLAWLTTLAAYSIINTVGLDNLNRDLKLVWEAFDKNVSSWMGKYKSSFPAREDAEGALS